MKQKLLSILAILMMAVPHSYAKVYESDLNYDEDELSTGESATIDGIVIRVNSGTIEFELGRDWQGYDGANSFTISTALGETITGIEITCDVEGINGTGWTEKTPGVVWSGSSTSVNVGGYLKNVTHIKVTVAAPVNVTANEGATGQYWATFYSNEMNYQAPEGTQVFKVNLTGTAIEMTEISDRIVKSGQGVVLKKTTSGSITMTPTSSNGSGDYSGNSLTGTMTSITNPGNAYVLNYKAATGAGFYKLKATGTIGANKAYLTYSGSLAPEFFSFDGNTTSINEVRGKMEDVSGEYYDLQGRRVSQPTKGLYIVNGKKVVIK